MWEFKKWASLNRKYCWNFGVEQLGFPQMSRQSRPHNIPSFHKRKKVRISGFLACEKNNLPKAVLLLLGWSFLSFDRMPQGAFCNSVDLGAQRVISHKFSVIFSRAKEGHLDKPAKDKNGDLSIEYFTLKQCKSDSNYRSFLNDVHRRSSRTFLGKTRCDWKYFQSGQIFWLEMLVAFLHA